MPPATHVPFTAATMGLYRLRPAQHRLDPVVEAVAAELLHLAGLDLALQFRDLGDVRLEVGADAEVAPDARHDGDIRVIVLGEAVPGRAQLEEVLHVQRVARLGTVDGDGDDVVVTDGVVDRHENGR